MRRAWKASTPAPISNSATSRHRRSPYRRCTGRRSTATARASAGARPPARAAVCCRSPPSPRSGSHYRNRRPMAPTCAWRSPCRQASTSGASRRQRRPALPGAGRSPWRLQGTAGRRNRGRAAGQFQAAVERHPACARAVHRRRRPCRRVFARPADQAGVPPVLRRRRRRRAALVAVVRRSPLPWSKRIALALLAGVLTVLASQGQWLWRQDESAYDALVGGWDYRPDPSVLIVAIDEGSLQRIGQWPWPRSIHARLLDRLTDAGAERVALDLVLSEPDRRDSRQDDALAAAIRRNGRVVLPVLAAPAAGDRMAEEMLPIPQIAASAAAIGHTDVEVDGDGVARGLYLHAGIGQPHWPALGLALAGLPAGAVHGLPDPDPGVGSPYQWRRDDYVRVRYAGPPERLPQVSYADVLDGHVDMAMLQGRRIVVGMTASGIAPRLLTPTTREFWMSGSEYQANIASMLLQHKQIDVLPSAWQQAISAVLVALCVLLLGLRLPWLAALASLPAAPLLSWLLLRSSDLWWAPATAMLGILLVLLAWAIWRISAWHRQANRDALTGLGNRLRFEQSLQQECDAARRSGKPLSLALIDVDHFKRHNDLHGHQVGDRVLRDVARLIGAHARRPRDMAARYGGDEFALVLPDTPAEGALLVIDDLIACVRALPSPGDGGGERVTLTIGVFTRVPDGELQPHHFVEGADTALYQAKANGRDGFVIDGA
ncbi:hypothetical protein G6F22_009666 [Rhizopus arrhizus]|nr:hypothetical protein G6F22_009666 [Rhizopus arrhizus]